MLGCISWLAELNFRAELSRVFNYGAKLQPEALMARTSSSLYWEAGSGSSQQQMQNYIFIWFNPLRDERSYKQHSITSKSGKQASRSEHPLPRRSQYQDVYRKEQPALLAQLCPVYQRQGWSNPGSTEILFLATEAQKGPPAGDDVPDEYTYQGLFDIGNNLLATDNLFYNPSALHGYDEALDT